MPSVQHRQEIGGDICLTTLEKRRHLTSKCDVISQPVLNTAPSMKTEAGRYAQISDSYVHMWYICYCSVYCRALVGCPNVSKTKTQQRQQLSSFLQLLQKVQVSW